MFGEVAIYLSGFLWGIRRGASTCMALCVPAIIPTLIEEKGDWRKGLKVALYYNTPRIILLTVLGVIIGAGGYAVGSSFESFSVGSTVWAAGYVIIGCMMIAYGTYIFASVSERLENLAEGKTECAERALHPLFSRYKFTTPRSRTGLLLWGGLVGIACVGETVLAVETLFVGVFAGTSTSPMAGALIGGFAFFLFALGTAVPTLIIAALSSKLAEREKRMERLLQIERIAGILMIGFGIMFVLGSAMFI